MALLFVFCHHLLSGDNIAKSVNNIISKTALYSWWQEGGRKGLLLPDNDAIDWGAADEFAAVTLKQRLEMNHNLGAYRCRKEYCRNRSNDGVKPANQPIESANNWDR